MLSGPRIILICAVALLFAPALLANSIILQENFDTLTPALAVTSAGPFHTVGGTNVDIVGGAVFGSLCVSPESGNCIDLDGSGGLSQGQFETVNPIALSPGVTYNLSFDLIGSQRGNTVSATVTFGPYNQTFVLASNDDTSGIVSTSFTVSSPTMANLAFQSNTPGNVGALLDNVLVTSSAGTVVTPEPATLLLMMSGLVGILVHRRIKHAARA